jgi:hypothetical protein
MTTKAAVRKAARREGIVTFDPETHSQTELDALLGA